MTFAALEHNTAMRHELDLFIATGAPLKTFALLFRFVLRFKFAPIVERSIEAAHGRVASAIGGKRKQHPVTVSLSNRLPELEARLSHDPSCFSSLADAHRQTSSAKKICIAFNLSQFPDVFKLLESKKHSNAFHMASHKLVYHTDTRLQYRKYTDSKRVNAKRVRQDIALSKKMQKRSSAEAGAQAGRLVVIDDVLRALMMEHFRKVVGAGRVGDIYSCHQPARDGLVQVGAVALPDALSSMDRQPATSVPENTLVSRVMLEDAGFDGNWTPVQPDLAAPRTPPELLPHLPGIVERPCNSTGRCFFKIVDPRPSLLRAMPIAPGAGRKLSHLDVCISLHKVHAHSSDAEPVIHATPMDVGWCTNHIMVLTEMQAPPAVLEETCQSWKPTQYRFAIAKCEHIGGSMQAATQLMQSRAFEGTERTLEFVAGDNDSDVLHAMSAVQCVALFSLDGEIESWQLTKEGASQVIALRGLSSAKPVFHIDMDKPLLQWSRWELAKRLLTEDWIWAPLPSRGHRHLRPYTMGQARMWYSDKNPNIHYLLCLVVADQLHEKELCNIPHKGRQQQWTSLLQQAGILPPPKPKARARLSPLMMEVDDGGMPMPVLAVEAADLAAEEDGGGGSQQEDADGSQREHSDSDGLDGPDSPDSPPSPPSPSDPVPGGAGPEPGDEGPEPGDEGPEPGDAGPAAEGPGSAPASPPSHAEPAPRGGHRTNPALDNHNWGCFRMTLRRGGTHDAWQVKCPWHRKSEKTGCTKSLNIIMLDGKSKEECSAMTLLFLKQWANTAFNYDTKWKHAAYNVDDWNAEALLPEEVIEAQCIHVEPEEEVIPDDALPACLPGAGGGSGSRPRKRKRSDPAPAPAPAPEEREPAADAPGSDSSARSTNSSSSSSASSSSSLSQSSS